jgi:hypothetical protein
MNEVSYLTVNQQNKKTTIKVKSTILVNEYHIILS